MADNFTVKLTNHLPNIKGKVNSAALAWLEEVSGEIEAQTKRNTAVGSAGAPTKNSWTHRVDRNAGEAVVGSPEENALWEEYGTGEYALNGDGRPDPWYVPVEFVTGYKRPTYNGKVVIVYGKHGQAFYKTNGKKPKKALHNAWDKTMPKAEKALKSKLKGLK